MAGDEGTGQAEKKMSSKGRITSIVIVLAIIVGEAVAIFLLANAVSDAPAPALAGQGENGGTGGAAQTPALAEVELAECRPSNVTSGRFITFHIRVSALVAAKDLNQARDLIQTNQARIEDRVNVVIRSAEPKELSEPGLETIRRRLKAELGRVLGDDEFIQQVLIPFMLQSGPGV